MSIQKILFGVLLVGVLGAIAFFGVQSLTGVSADQMRQAESACIRWFKKDSDLGGYDSFSSDTWEKDGHAVVEVGFDRKGSSYSTRLCVYDFERHNMSAPNNFSRGRWER